jgi:hypothetical protein
MRVIKVLILFVIFSISPISIAQPQGEPSASTSYKKELQSQADQGVTQAVNEIREAASRAAAFSSITKTMSSRVADPAQYATLAQEIGIGGSDISKLVERHAANLSEATVFKAMIESYPLARYPASLAGNNTQCQSDFWPNNFWCGDCLKQINVFGLRFCLLYGIAPANDVRFPTQMTSITRDNASAPLESSLTHEALSVLDDLNIPNLAGVGSMTGVAQAVGLLNVNQVLDTIELKRICVDAMLAKQAFGTAAGLMRAGTAGANKAMQDVIQNIGTCVMKAAVNPAYGLTKGQLETALAKKIITPDQLKVLKASMKRDVVGRIGASRTYQTTHTPSPLARYVQKSMKDVTYPSFRVLIALPSLAVYTIPVNDPLINHTIKEPFREPGVPNFSEAFGPIGKTNAPAATAEVRDTRVRLAAQGTQSLSDVGTLPAFDDSIGAPGFSIPNLRKKGQFDILNHIIGSSIGIPTMKLPMNQRMLKNQIMYFIQKNYAVNAELFIQQFKNPDFCTNPMLAAAFEQTGSFNFINRNNFFASLDKLSWIFNFLKLEGPTVTSTNEIIQKIKGAYRDNRSIYAYTRSLMCTKQTNAAINKPIAQAEGGQDMALIAKALARDINDIATKHVQPVPMKSPMKLNFGVPSGLPIDAAKLTQVINQLQQAIDTINNISGKLSQAEQISGIAGLDLPGLNDMQDATNSIGSGITGLFGGGQMWSIPKPPITNPYFYSNRYEGIPFVDKAQTSHSGLRKLVASAGGAPLSLSDKCRGGDISDLQARDEKLVFPGQEATIYNHFSAFLTCPAYKPIDKNSKVNGLPLGQIMDLILNVIPIPGGKRGLNKFIERFGQD